MSTMFVIQGLADDGNCFQASFAASDIDVACQKALNLAMEGSTVRWQDIQPVTGLRMATVGRLFAEYVITEVPVLGG